MTPDDLCKSGKEHGEQAALFCWAACAAQFGFSYAGDDLAYDHRTREALATKYGPSYALPGMKRLHAIHNQGHGDMIRGARAKAEGVRAGVPDTFLPLPRGHYAGLYIELKQQKFRNHKDGGLSDEQKDWIEFLTGVGYAVKVAYGWREAAQYIREYLT